jgi:hypothetical protein
MECDQRRRLYAEGHAAAGGARRLRSTLGRSGAIIANRKLAILLADQARCRLRGWQLVYAWCAATDETSGPFAAHQYPQRAFTTCGETSAATALASRDITALWSDYLELWPETVRAIFVSSARWTSQILAHVPAQPSKTDLGILFRRYGYGVPDMERARHGASNALTLIIEDTIPTRRAQRRMPSTSITS